MIEISISENLNVGGYSDTWHNGCVMRVWGGPFKTHPGTPAHQRNMKKQIVRGYSSFCQHKMHITPTIMDRPLHGFPSFTFIFSSFDSFFSSGLSLLVFHSSLFLSWLWAFRPQNVQVMIFVMIKQQCVMCVCCSLNGNDDVFWCENKANGDAMTIKMGLMEVNISIIMTLMNSGRQKARGWQKMELDPN